VPAPRVSVIVPVYNRPVYVRQAIDTALAQESVPGGFEVVVVDDGSTDDTPAVLASYGDRIRVVRQANGGVARARNAGFAAARGEYFALLDSDDLWLPGKLAAQVALLDANPEAAFAHSDVEEFFESGPQTTWTRRPPIVTGDVLKILLRRNVIHTMTVALRRRAIEEVGDFDPRYPPCEDWDLWLRLVERRPVVGDERVWVRTRVHEGGISANPLVVYTQACKVLAAAAARLDARRAPLAGFARRQASRWNVKHGRRLARAGRQDEAEEAFGRAVKLHAMGRLEVALARLAPKR
jgi:glycosyltransferase involved in cell wall biosynthesis